MGPNMPHFGELEFPKKGSEIARKAIKKVGELKAKIAERQKRIDKVVKDKKLRPEDLVALQRRHAAKMGMYAASTVNAAGYEYDPATSLAVNEQAVLEAETSAIESEKEQIKQLNLIARNLPAGKTFKLDLHHIEYLGF